jgi:glutaminyl-peptide cyclotransferase
MKYISIITIGISTLLLSCSGESKIGNNTVVDGKVETVTSKAPVFNQDSAYQYIVEQVNFGPRVPNTVAHRKCSAYFVAKLKSWDVDVIEQDFEAKAWDGTILKSKNVIGIINPKAEKRILLAAHWDTRPYADQEDDKSLHHKPIDGANDGASGVGVLMEIARIVQASKDKPNVGIDIVLFDSEDYGTPEFHQGESDPNFWCLGSQYWATHKHKPGYFAYYGILLDMIGAKEARFYKEERSLYYAESVVNKVWSKGQSLGYSNHFIDKPCGGITDDHVFVNKLTGIKMIDIIQYNDENEGHFFGDYWHTHDDNINVIDKNTLKAVGHTLIEVLYSEK